MNRSVLAGLALLLLAAVLAAQPPGQPGKVMPKLEPVAETKLLMEGLAHPNFRSLEKLLKQKPAEAQAWTFARGQALLIAETANLLMLRPPKDKQGQAVWFERTMQLRTAANQLAVTLANQEFEKSRTGLVTLANQCNRCHQTFRVPVEIAPFVEPPPDKTGSRPGEPSGELLDFPASGQ